jgi:hypothetical protein
MLSGHTHGGEIWPLGYLVRLRYPLFAGRYEVDGMTAIVGRGDGHVGTAHASVEARRDPPHHLAFLTRGSCALTKWRVAIPDL